MPQKRYKSEEEKSIIKTLWEARRNMNANTIAVAQKLGVNRPLKRRTFNETCNSEANSLFSTGKPIWRENCQCSIVAYELRRRGGMFMLCLINGKRVVSLQY